MAYVAGALMLPLWLIFERLDWRGWRYYVPTGAIAGPLANFFLFDAERRPWQFYIVCSVAGIACAIVFSLVLKGRNPLTSHPA